jgi:hypothetical protein
MDFDLEFILRNSPWVFLGYILIKELSPVVSRVVEAVVPGQLAKRKLAEEKTNELKQREVEIEEKRTDLRERQMIALEQMQRILIGLENNQRHVESTLQTISSAVASANQALIVVLDRNRQFRKEDISKVDTT